MRGWYAALPFCPARREGVPYAVPQKLFQGRKIGQVAATRLPAESGGDEALDGLVGSALANAEVGSDRGEDLAGAKGQVEGDGDVERAKYSSHDEVFGVCECRIVFYYNALCK
jgi:hypothetical protein